MANMAPGVRRHDGLLPGRRADARVSPRSPAAPTSRSRWSSATRRSRACSARPSRRRPAVYTKMLRARPGHGRAEPGRPEAAAGPRAARRRETSFSRKPLHGRPPSISAALRTEPTSRARSPMHPPARSNGRNGCARSATARWSSPRSPVARTPAIPRVMLAAGLAGQEGGRARPEGQAVGEDQPRPRLQRRHRLSAAQAGLIAARAARLPPGRLRLHDLHRQQRPAAGRPVAQAVDEGNLVAAAVLQRQPQLRGPHQSRW